MSFFGLLGPPNVRKLKEKENVQGLIKALKYKENEAIRQEAAEALVEFGVKAVRPLIKSFQDDTAQEYTFMTLKQIARTLLKVIETKGQYIKTKTQRFAEENLDHKEADKALEEPLAAANALTMILESSPSSIEADDLNKIVHLNDIAKIQGYSYHCGGEPPDIITVVSDNSLLKQLARQELVRRGLDDEKS